MSEQIENRLGMVEEIVVEFADKVEDCGFRRKPATHSDAKPASVPI